MSAFFIYIFLSLETILNNLLNHLFLLSNEIHIKEDFFALTRNFSHLMIS